MTDPKVTIRRLSTGYYHIRGRGPCEWAQPPGAPPYTVGYLRAHAFPEASEDFLREASRLTPADVEVTNEF
jgi:hypothetical protein